MSSDAATGSIHAILPLFEHLEERGCEVAAVLAAAGIPSDALADPNVRLPKARFDALWRAAIAATGDDVIALRVSMRARPSTLGVIGHLASASDSGRDAFELVRGLTPLLWENFACDLQSQGDTALIRFPTGARGHSRFTTEYAVGLTVAMSRSLGAPRSDPIEARFAHAAPEHAAEYERILRLPVRFDAGEDGVLFPAQILDRSNPTADAALRALLERYAAEQLTRIAAGRRHAERTRAALLAMLPLSAASAEAVAKRFSMSSRTLRRRLREEGTSFREILDEVRAELAQRYLADGAGIEEAAYQLGFSDQSAFTKAFRRWTGRTPTDFARGRS